MPLSGLSVSLFYKVNALRVRLSRVIDMDFDMSDFDMSGDSAFVKVINNVTGMVQVGTLFWSGDDWMVVFYAQNHVEVKVTNSFTVETIQIGNGDPVVNRLMNEHCAAAPDGDFVEAAAPELSRGCCCCLC